MIAFFVETTSSEPPFRRLLFDFRRERQAVHRMNHGNLVDDVLDLVALQATDEMNFQPVPVERVVLREQFVRPVLADEHDRERIIALDGALFALERGPAQEETDVLGFDPDRGRLALHEIVARGRNRASA